MHRSGTSLVADMLRQLGVFVGWRRDEHCEPHFLRDLNDWLLEQCGASWDNPAAFKDLLRDRDSMELAARYLCVRMRSMESISFWGRHAFAKRKLNHWGWKEPRTTITLPVWQLVYPNAIYLNVLRHGVDVAASLVTRQVESHQSRKRKFVRRERLYRLVSRRGGFTESYRCREMDNAFTLWLEYCRAAKAYLPTDSGQHCLDLRYEELLSNPKENLERICNHLHLQVDDATLSRVSGEANPQRAFAYKKNAAAVEFAKSVAEELGEFGYQ